MATILTPAQVVKPATVLLLLMKMVAIRKDSTAIIFYRFLHTKPTNSLPTSNCFGAADMMWSYYGKILYKHRKCELTDRLCEASLKTIINNVTKAMKIRRL